MKIMTVSVSLKNINYHHDIDFLIAQNYKTRLQNWMCKPVWEKFATKLAIKNCNEQNYCSNVTQKYLLFSLLGVIMKLF